MAETGEAGGPDVKSPSSLVLRNVTVRGRRTSLRLEQAMWDALAEIARREGTSMSGLCSRVDERRVASSLTAAVRVYVMSYYRAAATESGHASAGHGTLLRSGPRIAS